MAEANERTALLAGAATQEVPEALAEPDVVKPNVRTGRKVACMAMLGILIVLQATNVTILSVTQSEIAAELDAFEEVTWLTSSYLIAMSSAAPIYGKLAQILTARVSLAISTFLIAVGTLATGLSSNFAGFVGGRVVGGIGGGGMFVVSVIIMLDMANVKQRGLMFGLLNTTLTLGVSFGAVIAGALLPLIGWRGLFWSQSPIAAFIGIFLFFALPGRMSSAPPDKDIIHNDRGMLSNLARQDYLGALTLTLSIVLLLLGMSAPAKIPIAPIIGSAAVMVIFVLIELYVAREPIIPVALFKSRGLLLSCLATVGYMMSRWTILFYAPVFALAVRDWSPAIAGSVLIPTNTGFAIGGLLVGWLDIRGHRSFYWQSLLTYLLFPITMAALGYFESPTISPVFLVVIVFINGFITGASLNYSFAHILYTTPKSTHYMVTSIVTTVRGFSGSFASAVGGGFFIRALRDALTTGFADKGIDPDEGLIRQLLGSPALVHKLNMPEKTIAIDAYTRALQALWIATAVFAMVFALFQAGVGSKAADVTEVEAEETQDSA